MAANEILDPLTFKPLRQGSVVEVHTENGAIMKLKVVHLEDDGAVVLQKPSSKLVTFAPSESVIIHRELVVGKLKLRPGDKVQIKYKNGSVEYFNIDMIFNNDSLVISKPGKKKMNLLNKLKFLWQLRKI